MEAQEVIIAPPHHHVLGNVISQGQLGNINEDFGNVVGALFASMPQPGTCKNQIDCKEMCALLKGPYVASLERPFLKIFWEEEELILTDREIEFYLHDHSMLLDKSAPELDLKSHLTRLSGLTSEVASSIFRFVDGVIKHRRKCSYDKIYAEKKCVLPKLNDPTEIDAWIGEQKCVTSWTDFRNNKQHPKILCNSHMNPFGIITFLERFGIFKSPPESGAYHKTLYMLVETFVDYANLAQMIGTSNHYYDISYVTLMIDLLEEALGNHDIRHHISSKGFVVIGPGSGFTGRIGESEPDYNVRDKSNAPKFTKDREATFYYATWVNGHIASIFDEKRNEDVQRIICHFKEAHGISLRFESMHPSNDTMKIYVSLKE